jgi:hypothetical protein
MLILVLMIAAYAFAPEDLRSALAPWKPVLVLEWVLIWIFGIAWFMKGLVPRDSTLDRPADPFPQSRS